MTENTYDICGVKTTIDFSGDLRMNSYWKNFTPEDVFVCKKYLKSGLILLEDKYGKQTTISKQHCVVFKQKENTVFFDENGNTEYIDLGLNYYSTLIGVGLIIKLQVFTYSGEKAKRVIDAKADNNNIEINIINNEPQRIIITGVHAGNSVVLLKTKEGTSPVCHLHIIVEKKAKVVWKNKTITIEIFKKDSDYNQFIDINKEQIESITPEYYLDGCTIGAF